MASSGPNSGGTAVNDTGVGSRTWFSMTSVFTSDNFYAGCSNVGSIFSNYLKVTNFGFSIPSGSTIDGIEVTIERSCVPNGAVDSHVKIVKGGTIGSTNKASATTWTTSDVIATYGNASDLWGESWSYSDINDSTFGIALAADHTAFSKSGHTLAVDHITIKIYYTAGGVSKLGLLGVG